MGGKARDLTNDEIERIKNSLEGELEIIFRVGLGSGMRIGEIIGLTVGDVAPYGQVEDRIVLGRGNTKSKRPREVFITDDARDALRIWVGQCPRRKLFTYTANGASQALRRAFARARVKASSHAMRRTFANRLRRGGVDLKIIQECLGHSSLSITQLYFNVDPAEQAYAVKKYG